MLDFERKEVIKFLDTFALKITKEDIKHMALIDPYGTEFSLTPNSIIYKFNSLKNDTPTMIDTKILTHVVKSFDEFADYWRAKNSYTEISYTNEGNKSVGYILLHLK